MTAATAEHLRIRVIFPLGTRPVPNVVPFRYFSNGRYIPRGSRAVIFADLAVANRIRETGRGNNGSFWIVHARDRATLLLSFSTMMFSLQKNAIMGRKKEGDCVAETETSHFGRLRFRFYWNEVVHLFDRVRLQRTPNIDNDMNMNDNLLVISIK